MDEPVTATEDERRLAHRRVGAGAIAAFVLLLVVLAAVGRSAAADPSVPAGAPVATPTPQAEQTAPGYPDPGYRHRGGGFGRRGGGGGGGGGEPGFGGGGIPDQGAPGGGGGIPDQGAPGGGNLAPAPSTDGGGTTT
jgi:translation initiation factor IF-2